MQARWGIILGLLLLLLLPSTTCGRAATVTATPPGSRRPPPSSRRFRSAVVDEAVTAIALRMRDPVLADIFANCICNPLDTTIDRDAASADSFVITGDISAMWLRDAFGQVAVYLPFLRGDPALAGMVAGLINRMANSIVTDPYANAFNKNATAGPEASIHQGDERRPPMQAQVFEGKYELDSLAAFFGLSAR